MKNLEAKLETTLQYFAAYMTFNKLGDKKNNPELNEILKDSPLFWGTVNCSLRTSFFIDFFSLIENHKETCNFYTEIKRIRKKLISKKNTYYNENKAIIEKCALEIDKISEKYDRDYRNKLIAHNDHRLEEIVKKFNEEKFTFNEIEESLDTLSFIFTTLQYIEINLELPKDERLKLPEREDYFRYNATHNAAAILTERSTENFLENLKKTYGRFYKFKFFTAIKRNLLISYRSCKKIFNL